MIAHNPDLVLVTVAGGEHFGNNFSKACIDSWSRLRDVRKPRLMINGGLTSKGLTFALEQGFEVPDKHTELVLEAVRNRPGLAYIRRQLYTWRHIVDGLILYSHAKHIVFVDTDVYITRPIRINSDGSDFIYNCDDIPGFRGRWTIALREKLVPSINPGFIVIRPSAVDLDMLSDLISRYIVGQPGTLWWTRQTVLAVLVGNSQKSEIFDGEDVRVISGYRKRTAQEIRTNKWKILGDSRPMVDPTEARKCIEGAAVLHLAGRGKKWIHIAQEYADDESRPYVLRSSPAIVASPWESLLISMRLLLLQSTYKGRISSLLGRG